MAEKNTLDVEADSNVELEVGTEAPPQASTTPRRNHEYTKRRHFVSDEQLAELGVEKPVVTFETDEGEFVIVELWTGGVLVQRVDASGDE